MLNESFFNGNSEDQEDPFYDEEPKNNYSLVDILRVLDFERNPLEDLPACLRKGMPVSREQYQKDLETLPYFMFEYLYAPDEEMEETHRDNYNGIPRLDELARYVSLGNEISLRPEGKPKGSITALLLPEDTSESQNRLYEAIILDTTHPGYMVGSRTNLYNLDCELSLGYEINIKSGSKKHY